MSDVLITDTFRRIKNPPDNSKSIHGVKPSTSKNSVEDEIKILRDFDLNWVYGPCIGITRLERWNRAFRHGLNPSDGVKDILLANSKDDKYTQCIWNDYKNVI